MQGFPEEADEAATLLLMAVVRADQKVLKEELDLLQSFFTTQLQVSQDRLQSIQEKIARYSREAIPEHMLREALERLPESARLLLFSTALEIAMIDDELVEPERTELIRIGKAFGLSEQQVQARLLEVAERREDAFSLLDVNPGTPWPLIEAAYQKERDRYSPARLAKLGVAFQSLALDRLERIEWAYNTLLAGQNQAERPQNPVSAVTRELPARLPNEVGRGRPVKYEPQELEEQSHPSLWKHLPRILEEIWRGSERDWDIVQRRLGLVQEMPQTREQIARDYDLSKQSVRQIEIRGKKILRSLLLSGRFHHQHLHPTLVELCRKVFEAMHAARTEPVVTTEDYRRRLCLELGWDVFAPSGLYPLFEEWLEITRFTVLGEEFLFHSHQPKQIEAFEAACTQVHRYLKAQGGSASADSVSHSLYRKFTELRCSAELFLDLLPGVHLSEEGLVSLAAEEIAEDNLQAAPALSQEEEKLGRIVEEFFLRSLHTIVPFRVLGLHIQDAARVPYRVATSLLRYHPAVSRERVGGRLFVGLRRDWREGAASRRVRFQPSTQEFLDEFLRDRLQGEDRVALQELLPELQQETGAPAHELPSYLENSPACRVFERDGRKWLSPADSG